MKRPFPVLFLCVPVIACASDERREPLDTVDTSDTAEADVAPSCEDIDVEMPTCDFALAARAEGEPFRFTTSGCWTVIVDKDTVTVTDSLGRNTVQTWGHPHENLNGKHVKDWLGSRRTLLFPGKDGDVVLTMDSTGPQGVVTTMSLYDGGRVYALDNDTNTIVFSSEDPAIASAREIAEADGETARITPLRCERVSWDNEYTQGEDGDGTPLAKEPTPAPLGTTGGIPNPNQVNDLYDDPRLPHT